MAVIGEDPFTVGGFQSRWTRDKFSFARDTRVLVDPDGQVAGYVEVDDLEDPPVIVGMRLAVREDSREHCSPLMEWAEDRAALAVSRAPEGTRVLLEMGCSSEDPFLKPLLEGRGYEIIRNFYRMTIDFDGRPAEPSWPAGIEVRPFDQDTEMRKLVKAYKASFQDHWGFVDMPDEALMQMVQHQMQYIPYYDPEVWFVALDGDAFAGICLLFWQSGSRKDTGEVGVLGVLRDHRKRGLGLALLQHAFLTFYDAGLSRATLGVDATSLTGATRLYEKAGMFIERQTNVYALTLREGVDIMITELEE
jgi:GNAT superfamily N-acetyltransferase